MGVDKRVWEGGKGEREVVCEIDLFAVGEILHDTFINRRVHGLVPVPGLIDSDLEMYHCWSQRHFNRRPLVFVALNEIHE